MSVDSAPVLPALHRPELATWVVLCAAAAAVGVTAAAAAVRGADTLLQGTTSWQTALAWAVVPAAGTTGAVTIGLAQSRALRRRWPDLSPQRFVGVTVLVGAAVWAAGSLLSLTTAPGSVTTTGTAGTGHSWPVLVAGGALLGATAGGILGLAQAWSMPRRWRSRSVWVLGSAVAWMPAMSVIVLGAGAPGAAWPLATLLARAAVTGLLAGALLGLVLGWVSPSLDGVPLSRRAVLAALRHGRPRRLGRAVLGLRVTGRVTGAGYELPVMYVEHGGDLWVAVRGSSQKTWWRNLGTKTSVAVLDEAGWHAAVADLVPATDSRFLNAFAWYLVRWPHAVLGLEDPMVRIRRCDEQAEAGR